MVLNDWAIHHNGSELIDPFNKERVQPASYDLALGNEFIVFPRDSEGPPIDLADMKDDKGVKTTIEDGEGLLIQPQEFVLGVTEERITLPDDLVARLEGKSSIGRLGLLIHVTAGFVDPGWDGRLTLEIFNVRKRAIVLRPGLPFCQLSFTRMEAAAEEPYHGRYQGDDTVAVSRYGVPMEEQREGFGGIA